MLIPYYLVAAFTSKPFHGNPAGVCPLNAWLPDATLQQMASEHQMPETAFFVARPEGGYDLRWFSPTMEIDLCGHATLATAHVLRKHLGELSPVITFHTQSGKLYVNQDEGRLALDFPSRPPVPFSAPDDVEPTFSRSPIFSGKARDYLFLFRDENEVRTLRPDFARLAAWDTFGIIVTAPGDEIDFVSRFFAPRAGILEDSVTGSSHCTLIPFWAERLDKTVLHARQISARSGELFCELRGDRVRIAGHAVTYLEGKIRLN